MKGLKLFSLLLLMFLFSCGEDSTSSNDDNPNITPGSCSLILNGGEYSNVKVEFQSGVGGYNADENQTALSFTGVNQGLVLVITFSGNKAGTYTIGDKNGIALTMANGDPIYLTGGTIKVTSYGGFGSYIVGTFSGQAMSPTNPTITVKDGKFSALRGF